jgi:iron complex outermembrane receptor protein
MRGTFGRGGRNIWLAMAGCGLRGAVLCAGSTAAAQEAPVTALPEIQVIATTPAAPAAPRRAVRPATTVPISGPAPAAALSPEPGVVDRDKVPANVQTMSAGQFDTATSTSLPEAIVRALPGVSLGDQTGNPFQPDLNYRGFTASPVIGTPQGLAVYQNGTRINEVFGDVVNWDLIPEKSINRMTLMPSNPIYGLNAIGGGISVEMKNGFTYKGVEGEIRGGSFGRRAGTVQAGGQSGALSAYVTADAINDDGWRDNSGSRLRRLYADVGARGDDTEIHVAFTGASNMFGATAAAPVELLNQRWQNTYTAPQTTRNDLAFLTANTSYKPADWLTFQANAYYRGFWQQHLDGNTSDAALCTGDPSLLCLGDGASPLLSIAGTQIPSSQLGGAPVIGQIDRTKTAANSFGGSFQSAIAGKLARHENNFVIGTSLDHGQVAFNASSELGTIEPNSFPFVNGTGVILNTPAGDLAPVFLRATTLYTGIYATDTLDLTDRTAVTFGGRFNTAHVKLEDQLGSNLNGDHRFSRFNPVIGTTYKITPYLTAYAGYSEANRAPTPLELACADPARPCLIDSFLVSDPSLKQVVSHTFEAGLRGRFSSSDKNSQLTWSFGAFRSRNSDDIINVASLLPGHGFFQNAGDTLRRGVEATATYKRNAWNTYANYSFVDATFQSALTLASPNNPFQDSNGNISVHPGDHLPSIPQHRFKAGIEYAMPEAWTLGASLNVTGSQFLVGDEANQNPKVPAYWVVNLYGSYKLARNVEVFGLVQNLFNQRYYTAGTLFATDQIGFLNLTDPRAFTPGAPLAAYGGLRVTY